MACNDGLRAGVSCADTKTWLDSGHGSLEGRSTIALRRKLKVIRCIAKAAPKLPTRVAPTIIESTIFPSQSIKRKLAPPEIRQSGFATLEVEPQRTLQDAGIADRDVEFAQ